MPEATDDDLARWIASFRGPLVGLLASWGNDWHSAEELAADAFAEAWVGRARLAGDPTDLERVGAWLRGIAFHLSESPGEEHDRHRSPPEVTSRLPRRRGRPWFLARARISSYHGVLAPAAE